MGKAKRKTIKIITNSEARNLFDSHENKAIDEAQKIIANELPNQFNTIVSLSCSMGIPSIKIEDIVDTLPNHPNPKVRELFFKAVKEIAMANGYDVTGLGFILVK